MYMCVRVSILASVLTILQLDFGNVQTVRYFLLFLLLSYFGKISVCFMSPAYTTAMQPIETYDRSHAHRNWFICFVMLYS